METVVQYKLLSYGSGGSPEVFELGIDADEIEVINLSAYTEETPAPFFFSVDAQNIALPFGEWTDNTEIVTPNSSLTVERRAAGNAIVYVVGDGYCCVRGIKR